MNRYVRIEAGNVVEEGYFDGIEGRFHPAFVWVASATAQIGDVYDGNSFSSTPKPSPTVEDYDRALTKHLDAVASQRRYDNRITCALRAGYPGPFQAEGAAFASWMDTCNAQAYQLMLDVQAGLVEQPSIEAMIAALPPMQWPE